MAKWYMTPDNIEFSQWSPRSFAQHVNASFPAVEAVAKITVGNKTFLPLTDDGPTIPTGKVVDTRAVTVGADTATAGYTYRDKTAEELAAENDPTKFPLLPWQFKAMVAYLGKDAAIRAAINSMSDALQNAVAMSRYENATYYNYEDPFLQSMRVAISMSEEDLSAAWMIAKDLTSGA